MEKKAKKLMEAAKKILGEDSNFAIITSTDSVCCNMVHGDIYEIAQSFYSALFSENNDANEAFYMILKLNLISLLKHPNPYSVNLAEIIANVIPDEDERIQELQQPGN